MRTSLIVASAPCNKAFFLHTEGVGRGRRIERVAVVSEVAAAIDAVNARIEDYVHEAELRLGVNNWGCAQRFPSTSTWRSVRLTSPSASDAAADITSSAFRNGAEFRTNSAAASVPLEQNSQLLRNGAR